MVVTAIGIYHAGIYSSSIGTPLLLWVLRIDNVTHLGNIGLFVGSIILLVVILDIAFPLEDNLIRNTSNDIRNVGLVLV